MEEKIVSDDEDTLTSASVVELKKLELKEKEVRANSEAEGNGAERV